MGVPPPPWLVANVRGTLCGHLVPCGHDAEGVGHSVHTGGIHHVEVFAAPA